jgi:hypothetical protein
MLVGGQAPSSSHQHPTNTTGFYCYCTAGHHYPERERWQRAGAHRQLQHAGVHAHSPAPRRWKVSVDFGSTVRVFDHGFCCVRVSSIGLRLLHGVRFSTKIPHSRMPLGFTPLLYLKRCHACEQGHASRVFPLSTVDTVNSATPLSQRLICKFCHTTY